MEIYKRIASVWTQGEIDSLHEELEERFGPLPDEALSLLSLAEMRVLCRKLSIGRLQERAGIVTVEFFEGLEDFRGENSETYNVSLQAQSAYRQKSQMPFGYRQKQLA